MGMSVEKARQLKLKSEELVRAGFDVPTFAAALVDLLSRFIPHSAACVVTLDPATKLLTGSYKFGGLANAHDDDELWAQIEYGTSDPTRMKQIARQRVSALATSQLPGGTTDSIRMRELVHPAGYSDELRMVAMEGDYAWGGVNLFRASDERPFDAEEVALLSSLSGLVVTGLQNALVMDSAQLSVASSAHGPAVLMVSEDNQLTQVSMGSNELLSNLVDELHRSPATAVIAGLVTAAHRFAHGETSLLPRVRLRAPSGKWLIAQALPLASTEQPSGDVIVMIDEARSPDVSSLITSSFGLTSRESEVAELALQGMDTKGIAAALFISPYTVQDHLKSIFDKAGVRSRRELMAKVFFDHFAPSLGSGDDVHTATAPSSSP